VINAELKRIIEKKKVEHANDKERFINVIENYKSEINSEKTKVAELKVIYFLSKTILQYRRYNIETIF